MMTSNELEKAEEEFSRYHEKLRAELDRAYWHFKLLDYFKGVQQNYKRELDQAPGFWGLTVNAHVFSLLTRLNLFFGKKDKRFHLHMHSFLDFAKDNLAIFSKEAFERRLRKLNRYDELAASYETNITTEKVDADIMKLSNLPISGLRAWRNKILSHIDRKSIADNINIAMRYPVKMQDVKQIIETIDTMLNEYCHAFEFSTHYKDLTLEHGLQYVLDAIRNNLRGISTRSTL